VADPTLSIPDLCARALGGEVLQEHELEALLSAGPEDAEAVFAAAREARRRVSGDRVFLYGFIYFSTYCRNACAFCFYRADNRESPRYRKTPDEVVAICNDLAGAGVVLLDLTMGEDPLIHNEPGYAGLLDLVSAVRADSGLPVMVSPGVVPDDVLAALAERGADWYALYQETHTRELYERLRVQQPFEERVHAREAARAAGMLVEDGMLTGIGDTPADRARAVASMRDAGWEQVRIMTFVPQAGTPLEDVVPAGDLDELLTIAVLRLACPQALIPASLDVDGIAGLERRLNAGASVVTSIVPPTRGLAGVSQSELDIEEGYRTVEGVLPHLARLGLRAGTVDEYRAWLAAAHERAPVRA
jgi:methylornithine synthase